MWSNVNTERQNQKFQVCNQCHSVLACPEFKQMKIWIRWDVLRNVNYMSNILCKLQYEINYQHRTSKSKNVKFVISLMECGPSRVKQMEI